MKNLCRAELIREALLRGENSAALTNDGALVVNTAPHTGRSPDAKFIVEDEITKDLVDWKNNQKMTKPNFETFKKEYTIPNDLFVQEVYAGADPKHRLKVRIHTKNAWHSVFARNMFFLPTEEELQDFEPEFNLYYIPGNTADPRVIISIEDKEIYISGTSYAGEMKKSVFTVLNFLLPQKGILPMHCSVNVTRTSMSSTVFFGLSGTGKTTLSADIDNWLVGDDEHGWSDEGIFNFEGGCYAKTINLSKEDEPLIHRACHKFGTVLENVVCDNGTPDFSDGTVSQNSRASYPLEFVKNTWTDAMSHHPNNVIMLTCDAYGILPPIAKLNSLSAIEQFLLGYTAKVAGTEKGILEPEATFSHCFGAPFMPLRPRVYANLLKEKIKKHDVNCWLINTGWTGGPYGVGERMPISLTRRIVQSIQNGWMNEYNFERHIYTDLEIPSDCKWIPEEILKPEMGWKDKKKYVAEANKLMSTFIKQLKSGIF
jgi:phosphoenolpyruvate carboxykinase (ATP)